MKIRSHLADVKTVNQPFAPEGVQNIHSLGGLRLGAVVKHVYRKPVCLLLRCPGQGFAGTGADHSARSGMTGWPLRPVREAMNGDDACERKRKHIVLRVIRYSFLG